MENNSKNSNSVNFSILGVSLGAIINPILVILLLTSKQIVTKKSNKIDYLFSLIFITVIFFFREYGVDWTKSASDDSLEYIRRYNDLANIPLLEVFTRFFIRLGDLEPLWYLPWWFLKNWLNGSNNLFLFLQYLLSSVLILKLGKRLDGNNYLFLILFYLFLFPDGVYSNVHLFRAQIAFLVFSIGLTYLDENKRIGYSLILISAFFQISTLFLSVLIIFYFQFFDQNLNKNKLLLFCILITISLPIFFKPLVDILATNFGFSKILNYLQIEGSERIPTYIKSFIIAVFSLIYWRFGKPNSFVFASIILNFLSIGFFFMFPKAQIIYERLFIFSLPLLSLSIGKFLLEKFSSKLIFLTLIPVYLIVFVRLFLSYKNQSGVYRYLAFGELMDPFSGIIKIILEWLRYQ